MSDQRRADADHLVSNQRGNVCKTEWKFATDGNLPTGVYKNSQNDCIVLETINPTEAIIRTWNSAEKVTAENQNKLKFLIAKKESVHWVLYADSNKSFSPTIVRVDAPVKPNIYVGKNEQGEVGTVAYNQELGMYAFAPTRDSESGASALEVDNYYILCRNTGRS